MNTKIDILITGHGEPNLEVLQDLVGKLPRAVVHSRNLSGAAAEAVSEAGAGADVRVHFLGLKAEKELESLAAQNPQSRPATLIVYDRGMASAQLVRLAMRAGARDFIMGEQVVEDTMAALRKIIKEDFSAHGRSQRALTAVVNAKGGAGASTVAGALAHAFAREKGLYVLLLDLDVQFGSQCLRLDLHPEQGLMEALASVETLDEIALAGYVVKHPSGLHVLSALTGQVILPGEINEARLARLLDLLNQCYQHVVVDLPRLIDPLFNLLLERAGHVIVVLQQDMASLRDAQRMIQIMTHELGVPMERIVPVVNRYQKHQAIGIEDVERILAAKAITVVPNDFKNLNKAANLGVPIADYAPRTPATLAILNLADRLAGTKAPPRGAAFRRWLSGLFPGE